MNDWAPGAYITIERGYLPALSLGAANDVVIDYWVELPSGRRVRNGGSPEGFRLAVSGDIPSGTTSLSQAISRGGYLAIAALAAFEGVSVHLPNGIIMPDGTFTPTP